MADWKAAAGPPLTQALRAKDQEGFSFLLVLLVGSAPEDEIRAFATELLANMDHDTQTWWLGECNCDGHLN